MYGRLALSNTHGLYEYGVETGGLGTDGKCTLYDRKGRV